MKRPSIRFTGRNKDVSGSNADEPLDVDVQVEPARGDGAYEGVSSSTFRPPPEVEAPPGAGRNIVLCVSDPIEWPLIREAAKRRDPACFPTTSIPLLGLLLGDTLSAGFCLGEGRSGFCKPPCPGGECGHRQPYLTDPITVEGEYWQQSSGLGGMGSPLTSRLLSELGKRMIPFRGTYGGASPRTKDGILVIDYG